MSFENGVDSDQMASDEATDQDLQSFYILTMNPYHDMTRKLMLHSYLKKISASNY